MVQFIRSDLDFILQQILYAEAGGVNGSNLVSVLPNVQVPFGLRTVDGTDTEIGGMATWAVVKAQARDVLGINLTDADVFDVPLLATDAYGNFIPGTNGFPQVVVRLSNGADGLAGTNDDVTTLVEGNPANPISPIRLQAIQPRSSCGRAISS